MKKFFSVWSMVVLAVCVVMTLGAASAQKPAAPKNLRADVVGHRVNLSWENADMGEVLLETGFEKADASGEEEDASLAVDGWTVETTNDFKYFHSWFRFPTAEFIDLGNYEDYIYAGEHSAVLYFDGVLKPEHPMRQDEKLISPVLDHAAYLEFNYYIDPMILTYGQYEDFPDRYWVVVSHDGGETWSDPLWDGRFDVDEEPGWHKAALALPEPSANMKIAFWGFNEPAVDGNGEPINEGLHFLWAIDEVKIARSVPEAVTEATALPAASFDGMATYRPFESRSMGRTAKSGRPTSAAKMPVIKSYKITLDGKPLAENILNVAYADKSDKTLGEHTYAVYAVTAAGEVSEPAEVKVGLKEAVFADATNFQYEIIEDEEMGQYDIVFTWEAPEGDFQPISYTMVCDGDTIGVDLTLENIADWGFMMTGYAKGLYEFTLFAVYKTPDGLSAGLTEEVALGVRHGVSGLAAKRDGKDVTLTWNVPQASEFAVASYTVYRAGEKLSEGLKETTWRDAAVADGLYEYTVMAVYEDGEVSPRRQVSVQIGDPQRITLPYSQDFNTTFCPANWRTLNESIWTPDRYVWYFDDHNGLGIKGDGFDGGFAAVDCLEAGMYPMDAVLELPAIDLSAVKDRGSITLSFYYDFATAYGESEAGVEWSIDGTEWYVYDFVEEAYDNSEEPAKFSIQYAEWRLDEREDDILKAVATAESLYFRFHYMGEMDEHFAIDNVRITCSDTTAVERPVEDMSVVVSASAGMMRVTAAQAIRRVEVYALSGVKLAERIGGEACDLTMPVVFRGPAVVRVTTDRGVKVVKVLCSL